MVMRSLAAALLTVGLVACGSDDGGSVSDETSPASPTPPVPATTAGSAAAPAAVPTALDFDAPTVGGGTFDARAYAGQPLALWFWAPY